MPIILPSRIVLPSSPALRLCPVTIAENATQTITVSAMSCCTKTIRLCIAQFADKRFIFNDAASADYSGASEITFDVWERATGASLLSKSLSGGSITLTSNNSFTLSVTDVESGAMSKGNKACEAWVTLSGGERRLVGRGAFSVTDTRKYD